MAYKIAALTMSYNEGRWLDLWLRHYGEAFGYDCLFVVDHGSEPPPELDPRINRIRVPRTVLDEREKVDFISDLTRSLLHYFDAVVMSDVDEFIVVDPAVGKTLPDYIETSPYTVIHPVGLNVVHNRAVEPDLTLSGYLFDQRRFVQFDSLYSKPSIIKEPIAYGVGLHRCDKKGHYANDLFLFHLRAVDYALAKVRYEKFQALRWADRDKDLPLAHFHSGFDAYAAFIFRMNTPEGYTLNDSFQYRWEAGVMNALEAQRDEALSRDQIASGEALGQLPVETRAADLIPERFRRTIVLG